MSESPLVNMYRNWGQETAALFGNGEPPVIPLMRYQNASWSELSTELPDVRYSEVDVDGLRGIRIEPDGELTSGIVLYFHGGGYVGGSADTVRKLAAHIAKASSTVTIAIDYRRAPEDLYPAQLEDAVRAYEWATKSGYTAEKVIFAGDSAGGLLATVAALYLRDNSKAQVGGIVGLSPFYDVDAHSDWFDKNAETDVLSTRDGAAALYPMWAGEASVGDPYITPLSHDLTGLPPVYISFGGAEALVGGAIEFEALAKEQGVAVELDIVPDQQHVFHYMAGRSDVVDAAIKRIGGFVRSTLTK